MAKDKSGAQELHDFIASLGGISPATKLRLIDEKLAEMLGGGSVKLPNTIRHRHEREAAEKKAAAKAARRSSQAAQADAETPRDAESGEATA